MLNYAAKLAILVLGLFALLLPAGGEGREFLSYNSISSANIATFNPANPIELKWHSLELVPPQDASSLTQDVTFVFDGVRKTVKVRWFAPDHHQCLSRDPRNLEVHPWSPRS